MAYIDAYTKAVQDPVGLAYETILPPLMPSKVSSQEKENVENDDRKNERDYQEYDWDNRGYEGRNDRR